METFVGQIIMVGFSFAPQGFALCNGQTLSISSYSSLYSLIGSNYGGNGVSTMGLPDLRGRIPMGMGNGPGLSNRNLGDTGGVQNITISISQLPSHSHGLSGATLTPGASGKGVTVSNTPDGNYLGNSQSVDLYSNSAASGSISGLSGTTDTEGSGQSISNLQPYTVVNFLIALDGTYPPRS